MGAAARVMDQSSAAPKYGSVPTHHRRNLSGSVFENSSSGHLYPDWVEAASIFSTRILASRTYYVACIVMILLNTFLVIWVLPAACVITSRIGNEGAGGADGSGKYRFSLVVCA